LVLGVGAPVAAGVVAGRAIWLRLGETIASFLSNLTVTPSDSSTIVFAAGVLVVTALVAAAVPVLRATNAGR
jgi:hypothetical protein